MLILDAGALVAVERSSRDVIALIKRERLAGRAPITHGGVVGQEWRGGGRQAKLARLLPALDVVALDADLGRRAGALLARSRTTDVIDAALALLAQTTPPGAAPGGSIRALRSIPLGWLDLLRCA